jgi:hypothetical protein
VGTIDDQLAVSFFKMIYSATRQVMLLKKSPRMQSTTYEVACASSETQATSEAHKRLNIRQAIHIVGCRCIQQVITALGHMCSGLRVQFVQERV